MNFLHPLDIIKELLTGPIAIACYVVLAFVVGFVLGKWNGTYG